MHPESNNLNVLRAVAVLSVFFSHCIQYLTRYDLPLGHAGVVLFFLHTSLVLMMSLERQGEERRWPRFMLRRVFRIYPLSACAVALYAALRIPWIVGHRTLYLPHVSAPLVLGNLSLTQNLFAIDSIPGVLWSLPLEIQMYMVLPALFLVVRKRRSPIDLIAIWIVLLAASIASSLVFGVALTSLFLYVPCFAAGCISYALARRHSLPAPLFLLLLGIVVTGMVFARNFMPVKWGLCLALGLLIPQFKEFPDGWFSRYAALIAKYSFGIYLFHSALLTAFLPRFGWAGVLPALALTIAISALAYFLIEEPFIRVGRDFTSPVKKPITSVLSTAFSPVIAARPRLRTFFPFASSPDAPSAP